MLKPIALALALVAGSAHAGTIGLHLGSYHPEHPTGGRYNDANVGAFYRADAGWQVGVYHNSVHRPTVYAGWTWSVPVGPVSAGLMAGVATGYRVAPVVPFIAPSVELAGWRLTLVPASSINDAVFHLSYEWSMR